MMARILDSLIFDHWVIWDNSQRQDFKTAGRYQALTHFDIRPIVYFQDDDVVVPAETQRRLCEAYMPGVVVANYGHGDNDGGYGDLPLVCGGAILDAYLPIEAMRRYEEHFPLDEEFNYYCDFALGVLYEDFRHLYLPFHIELPVAQHPSRLCNQPWAADMKAKVTAQGRQVRDMVTA